MTETPVDIVTDMIRMYQEIDALMVAVDGRKKDLEALMERELTKGDLEALKMKVDIEPVDIGDVEEILEVANAVSN